MCSLFPCSPAGSVNVAQHQSGVKVTLKVMEKDKQGVEESELQEEIDFFIENSHPNICNLVDFYTVDNQLCVAMEVSLNPHVKSFI